MFVAKILIIDDDAELCEEIAEILTDEGYETTVINDPRRGREAGEAGNYDLLLLDLKMPGTNGEEILKALRGRGVRKPVLVVSGNSLKSVGPESADTDDSRRTVLDLADGLVGKPFDIPQLLARIKTLLDDH
jgi:two-component system copper resistance phosphate regulon response regulator CusR